MLTCAAALLLAACDKEKATPAPVVPVVQVVEAAQRDVPITMEWVGAMDGNINAAIRPQVTGYLIRQNYREGDLVKKGQLLFEIDPRTFEAAVDEAAGIRAQKVARLDTTSANLARIKPLAEKNAVSQKDLDDATGAFQSAKAELEADDANLKTAKLNLGFTKITSPITGIAGIAKAQIGDLLSPSGGELTTVSSVDPIKVYFNISEQEYLKVATAADAAGKKAQDVPLEPMTGTFVAISDANLRAKPEGTAPRVGRITKGTKLTALGRATGSKWVLVAPPGGDPAFVYADLLAEPGKEAVAAPPEAPPTAAAAPAPAAPAAAAAASAGAPAAAAATTTAAAERKAPLTRSSSGFVDCEQCPELIRINPGSFTMGLDGGDPSRQPAHKVAIDKPFALGRYEVTNAQWHACELAKACTPTRMTDPADDTPVYNVHWQDAMAYIAWLSKTTGKRYRLPSEAEWEYAARGGTTTRYWWGDKIEAGKVICRQCGGSGFDRLRPPPVASQPPNPWALVGMSGGVAEWVADCWFHNYADAPRKIGRAHV
mgnify:CR=1 FL=1